MENFADFIIEYIENKPIQGTKGWLNQLNTYEWNRDTYPKMVSITREFWKKSTEILNTPDNNTLWHDHCKRIRKWGHMPRPISLSEGRAYKNCVLSLNKEDPDIISALTKCPACKLKRIAMATKIYYFSNPLKWTIYDSRVGFALDQLIFEYAKKREISPESVFPNNEFCIPEAQTCGRNSVYGFGKCSYSKRKSLWSFIWTSHLHRMIARKLNTMEKIEKPDYCLSEEKCWELPHIEMVFFMLGESQWVDVNDNVKGLI
jgi:hypothetical protein